LADAKNRFTALPERPAKPVRLFLGCASFVKMSVAGIISSSNKLANLKSCKSAAFLSGKGLCIKTQLICFLYYEMDDAVNTAVNN
jgi:hypothetical protein